MRTKTWDTKVVLSAASGRFVCKDFGDMHAFVEWWCGFPVWTHQLPRIAKENTAAWRDLFLRAAEGTFSLTCSLDYKGDEFKEWADQICRVVGDTMEVSAPPKAEMEPRDPVQELTDMVGKDRVAVVEVGEAQ